MDLLVSSITVGDVVDYTVRAVILVGVAAFAYWLNTRRADRKERFDRTIELARAYYEPGMVDARTVAWRFLRDLKERPGEYVNKDGTPIVLQDLYVGGRFSTWKGDAHVEAYVSCARVFGFWFLILQIGERGGYLDQERMGSFLSTEFSQWFDAMKELGRRSYAHDEKSAPNWCVMFEDKKPWLFKG